MPNSYRGNVLHYTSSGSGSRPNHAHCILLLGKKQCLSPQRCIINGCSKFNAGVNKYVILMD